MTTYFNGFDTQEVTFKAMTNVAEKRVVALQNSGNVYYPEAGAPFTGIVSAYRNGLASVIVRGYAEASFKNTIPKVGICKLAPGATGYLEVDETNGTPYTVVSVDTASKTLALIL